MINKYTLLIWNSWWYHYIKKAKKQHSWIYLKPGKSLNAVLKQKGEETPFQLAHSLLSAFSRMSSNFTLSGFSGKAQLVSRSDVIYSSFMSSELWPESLSDFKNCAVDCVWPPVSITIFLAVGPSNLKNPNFREMATPGMHRTEDRTRKAAMAPAHQGYVSDTIINWKKSGNLVLQYMANAILRMLSTWTVIKYC